ncbi:MAG: hypothetical protein KDK90_13905 [Leptospiraceae bacterium]|nr:hypothetical protein [Leptospiraceae bacterium]
MGRKEKSQIEFKARLDERNNIINLLSHKIKNMVSSSESSLLKVESEEQFQKGANKARLKNTIKTLNTINQLVTGIDSSFKVTKEDLEYDTQHKENEESISELILHSIRYSVENILSNGYNFGKFQENYFPNDASLELAQAEWSDVLSTPDKNQWIYFLNKHFFTAELQLLDDLTTYTIGDKKNSKTNLFAILQEAIFNGIKYSSYVPYEKRKFKILSNQSRTIVSLKVENTFDSKILNETKGVGHIIIENAEKFLDSPPIITKDNGIFSVELKIPNFWKKQI